jgi:PhnB protein
MTKVNPVPAGRSVLTPYLVVKGAAQAIEFYTKAFGARERMRMPGPDGTIGHAEIEVGDSVIMLADAPERAADTRNGVTSSLLIYVDDVDSVFRRALGAGATEVQPLEDKFYGDRMGMVRDPVSPEEMQRRADAMPAMS